MGKLFRPVDHVVEAIQHVDEASVQETTNKLESVGYTVNHMARVSDDGGKTFALGVLQLSGDRYGGYSYVRPGDWVVFTGEEFDIFTNGSFQWRYAPVQGGQ